MVTVDESEQILALVVALGVRLIPSDQIYNKRAFTLTM